MEGSKEPPPARTLALGEGKIIPLDGFGGSPGTPQIVALQAWLALPVGCSSPCYCGSLCGKWDELGWGGGGRLPKCHWSGF